MDIEMFRDYCLQKPGTTESFPFDNETLVFKVGQKMFALANVEKFDSVNLKCDPELAVRLRETWSGVKPGYHMNKVHWNTVACDGSVPDRKILEWTDHSYDLIVKSLPRKVRNELSSLSDSSLT